MVDQLTQRHRSQQLLLRRATMEQVGREFPALNFARLDETYPRLAVRLAAVVQENRRTSAGLSASYVRQYRASQRLAGRAPIDLVSALNPDQFNAALSSTSVAPIKKATARGVLGDVAMQNALALVGGSMARLVLDAGRQTLTTSLASDSKALGYARVLGGNGCDFCQMLAGRGEVYSAETVEFEAHDKCGCTGEPVYRT
jgi:hypothetical protein